MASLTLEEMMSRLSLEDPQPQPSERRREIAHDPKNRPPTDGHILSLPVELLMDILEYLAPDDVQPYMDSASFRAYKTAQKDIRNVCLVSKQMAAVARPYLYRAVLVDDVDVLAYLLRTLDAAWPIGQHVKRLVLQVPSTQEENHYRKPNVAVFDSRPNYHGICRLAAELSDATQFKLAQKARLEHNNPRNLPGPMFMRWIRNKEYEILGLMHFEFLLRTNNLESLSFGDICSAPRHLFLPYNSVPDNVSLVMGTVQGKYPARRFLPKLRELELLRFGSPHTASFFMYFLGSSTLRALKSIQDDGNWFNLDPCQEPGFHRPPSIRQYPNVRCIDLERSRCTPEAIFHICTIFPSLEYMSISGVYGSSATSSRVEGFETQQKSLSTGLAKLKHLRELALDLHYKDDVKAALGQHGVLSLSGLNELVRVQVPLHFLVKRRPGNPPFITKLSLVLPPSVKYLTVWADRGSVRIWGPKNLHPTLLMTIPQCSPRRMALKFLDSISAHVSDHFKALEDVTYWYRNKDFSKSCYCNGNWRCSHCEAVRLLDPRAVDDSLPSLQDLSSRFEGHGIRLSIVGEVVQPVISIP